MSTLVCPGSVRRVQLGAMTAGGLLDRLHERLFDETWLHFGDYDDPLEQPPSDVPEAATGRAVTLGASGLYRLSRASRHEETVQTTYFVPFWYRAGSVLPFPDASVDFVFSEHFFEHLFLDEACELFKECHRVLTAGGCLRVVVPDADLRTYEAPEPAGFSTDGSSWTDPGKHKSRWSIYSLSYVLKWIGFATRGIVYCDRFGTHHVNPPQPRDPFYVGCTDQGATAATDYIVRFRNSLIVDGVKSAG